MTRRPRETDWVRSEPRPGWGTVAPRSWLPGPPRSLSPHQLSDYLAGTQCSQGSWDIRRARTGCPVPASERTLGDPERWPHAGWARASQFEKSRSGTHLSSIAPAEPPPSLPLGRGAGLRRGLGALHCGAAGRAAHARGGGTRRGHIGGWDFGGRDAAQGL